MVIVCLAVYRLSLSIKKGHMSLLQWHFNISIVKTKAKQLGVYMENGHPILTYISTKTTTISPDKAQDCCSTGYTVKNPDCLTT